MAKSETQEFERLNLFKKVVEEVDGRVCHIVVSESESVGFVRIESHIPSF